MIFITNVYKTKRDSRVVMAKVIHCGRGTHLGNPFMMLGPSDRERVCDLYDVYFYEHVVHYQDKKMLSQLADIQEAATKGDVALECFCAPKRCHCETIKSYVEQELSRANVS